MRTASILLTSVTLAAIVACGSGGPNPESSSGATSSSGGSSSSSSSSSASSSGSSGAEQCGAICESSATLTFDESNAGARLEGALVEACRASRCVRGNLTKRDAGSGYQLTLASTLDASSDQNVRATVEPAPAADSLRFRVQWSLGFGTEAGLVEGETYSVSGRVSEDGIELFTREFTAAYQTERVCGTVCKVYEAGP